MNDLIDRIRNDQRYFLMTITLWVFVMIIGLVCVMVAFFGGSDSDTPPATDTAVASKPTIVLSGATVIAASPAYGDSEGMTPPPPPSEATSAVQSAGSSLPPFSPDQFGYGIQVQGSVGNPATTIASVKQLGMTWIKQQVRWDDMEPHRGEFNWEWIDGIINDANAEGIYVMLSVVTAPAWTRTNSDGSTHGPPDNYEEFGRFIGDLVDRYQGKVQAIEVWNEQNLDREWQTPDGLSAEKYVELLKVAHREIKKRDSNIIVISGALSPTGLDDGVQAIDDFRYFGMMLDAGMLQYTDCVGAHHNGINMPPDKNWNEGYDDPSAIFRGPFDNPHHSWSFKSTLQGYSTMMGAQKKLCVTEFGWASSQGFGGTPDGFGFADDNTQEEQAQWTVQAFQLQRGWGITWIAYLWNLNYANTHHDPTDPNIPYSIVNFDGVPRPAFNALEQMEKP